MSITTLYNTEQSLKNFGHALEYARDLNPLAADIAMHMKAGDDSFGVVEQFANKISKPIYEVISTQQGLDAAKEKYADMADDLPDHAKKTVMMVLHYAPENIRKNANDMLTDCLRQSDADTQCDFLITGPFDHTQVESGNFDIDYAKETLAACDTKAQDYIFEASAHEAMVNLGLHAFNVRVSKSNTGMALMRDPSDAVIPYDQIENDQIRAYCEEHEKDISNSVAMLHPNLSEEVLDRLETVYSEHGFTFDREAESNKRSQEFRENIAGMTRDDYWNVFTRHANVMQAVIEVQTENTPAPGADNTHEHD